MKTVKPKYAEAPYDPRSLLQIFNDCVRWGQWEISRWGRSPKKFEFDGKSYLSFSHNYNRTWGNERAVEVPIVWKAVQSFQGKRILEFGNVLSHYFKVNHPIIDKYENGKKIIPVDIVDFRSEEKFDLVISISTLEHVGWDETPQENGKAVYALDVLKSSVNKGGQLIFTVPVGHNPHLDQYLRKEYHGFKLSFLKRQSPENDWVQIFDESIWACHYGSPFPAANGLVIGFYQKGS